MLSSRHKRGLRPKVKGTRELIAFHMRDSSLGRNDISVLSGCGRSQSHHVKVIPRHEGTQTLKARKNHNAKTFTHAGFLILRNDGNVSIIIVEILRLCASLRLCVKYMITLREKN